MKYGILFSICLFSWGVSVHSFGQENKKSIKTHVLSDLTVAVYNQDSLKKHFEYYAEKDEFYKKQQSLYIEELDKLLVDYQNFVEKNDDKARRGLLSQNQLQSISEQIKKKEEEIQRFENKVGVKIEEETTKALIELGELITKYSTLFCKKKDIDILLIYAQGGQLAYFSPTIDVTTEYINYLNKMIPVQDKKKKKKRK